MKIQRRAKILSNKEIAPERFLMRCEEPAISSIAEPGQFLMVRCSDGPAPFLRRPFAFHSIRDNGFYILYQVIGPGTEVLSLREKGEGLDIIGPLGNSFSPASENGAVMVAGGVAVAPLVALAERLPKKARTNSIAIIGAGTKSHILCREEFRRLGIKVEVATEDGSAGRKGLATELLKKVIAQTENRKPKTAIYACGPKAMLKEVAKIAKQKRRRCEVSLEEKMGCGTGICLGCAVKTTSGIKLVCKDGPVFNAGDIIW
ncbi:MAG: dihydroorotate dehydrogenase electron transfer subunit [Candidatus Omnitrophota bacterium]